MVMVFFEETFPTTGFPQTFKLLLRKLKDLGIQISAEQVTEKLLCANFNNMSKMSEYLAKFVVANDRQLNDVKDSQDEVSRVIKAQNLSDDSSKISRD